MSEQVGQPWYAPDRDVLGSFHITDRPVATKGICGAYVTGPIVATRPARRLAAAVDPVCHGCRAVWRYTWPDYR